MAGEQGRQRTGWERGGGSGLFGPFRIEGLLGSGGMGEVYRARDIRLDRVVALKLLPEGLTHDRQFRERFQREARLTAQLREPHVVPVHGCGEIDGRLYLDMRLLEGEDLGSLLRREQRLEPHRAVAVVEQVAQALDAAHHQGLVHRDVKPSNIILGRNDFAYLVDFGIAHAKGSGTLTATGSVVGTLAYMAPERFRGDDSRPAVDVYALACVLFECLTGAPPFRSDDAVAALHAHLHQPPPSLRNLDPRLARALDPVVVAGLAKDPDARPRRATDLTDEARGRLRSPAASATRVAPPRRAVAPTRLASTARHEDGSGRPASRWGLVLALAAVSAVAVALVVLVVVGRAGPLARVADAASPSATSEAGASADTATATSSADSAPAAAGALSPTRAVDTVRDYYTLVPAHLDEAWTFIGPHLRLRGGGFADYQQYWSQYSGAVVQDAVASGPATVRVTILLLTDGSARYTEVHRLRLIDGGNGSLLIDADSLISHESTGH